MRVSQHGMPHYKNVFFFLKMVVSVTISLEVHLEEVPLCWATERKSTFAKLYAV